MNWIFIPSIISMKIWFYHFVYLCLQSSPPSPLSRWPHDISSPCWEHRSPPPQRSSQSYKRDPRALRTPLESPESRSLLAPGSKFLWAAGSMFSLQPGNSPLKHRSIDKYVRNQKKKGIIAETRRKVVTPQSTVHTSCNCKNLIKAISSFSLSILISKDLLNAR